jgi:hypothetical protein
MATQKEIEAKGGVLCDNFSECGNRAEYNLQGDGYVLWEVSDKGEYEKLKEWGLGEGDQNEHLCEPCAEAEGII